MQKSGVPIAERPNLLLKRSGRVNRILGLEEDLAGPLAKSLRQAKRQKSANAGPRPDCGKRLFDLELQKGSRFRLLIVCRCRQRFRIELPNPATGNSISHPSRVPAHLPSCVRVESLPPGTTWCAPFSASLLISCDPDYP
jgi:hypothetical protein